MNPLQSQSTSTVLLVEDEVLLREGVQEMLEAHGFDVLVAGDGLEALELLQQTPVSVVVTDLVMPNMNGVDFISQVQQQFPQLPVIVASGSPGSVMTRLGIETIQVAGAIASIMKPFKGVELVALIKQVLTKT